VKSGEESGFDEVRRAVRRLKSQLKKLSFEKESVEKYGEVQVLLDRLTCDVMR
jgi:hypothetical protein